MNERITKLFSCCLENEVILFETNLSEFQKKFEKIESESNSYRQFNYKFKQTSMFKQTINGKEYTFQQLV